MKFFFAIFSTICFYVTFNRKSNPAIYLITARHLLTCLRFVLKTALQFCAATTRAVRSRRSTASTMSVCASTATRTCGNTSPISLTTCHSPHLSMARCVVVESMWHFCLTAGVQGERGLGSFSLGPAPHLFQMRTSGINGTLFLPAVCPAWHPVVNIKAMKEHEALTIA